MLDPKRTDPHTRYNSGCLAGVISYHLIRDIASGFERYLILGFS